MNAALKKMRSPEETALTWSRDTEPEYIKERRRYVKNMPGFWLNLLPIDSGFEIVNLLVSLDFEPHVLTKAPNNVPNGWKEKVQWCREYLPNALVTITEKKDLVYGKVLFDDWPPYVSAWLEHRPRGLVIMPTAEYNKDYRHSNVIHYDGSRESYAEVQRRLVSMLKEYAKEQSV